MPLLTYLSPALKLDLSSNIGVTELAKAVGVLSSAALPIEDSHASVNANSTLLKAINDYDAANFLKAFGTLMSFDDFDETTWILLHLSKNNCSTAFAEIFQKITNFLAANTRSKNAMQARLFLMSHLSKDAVIESEWIAAIFDSNDPWACFALLSCPNFAVETIIGEQRLAIDTALKHATYAPYTGEEGKTKYDSLLWVFMKSTGISAESKKKLLHNIAVFDFTEEEIRQWPIEVLATLVTVSNGIADDSDLVFRAALFRSYILNVPVKLSSTQQEEIDRKSTKNHWNIEQKRNAELTMLQGDYFIIIDKFLGLIGTPKLFNAIGKMNELTDKLNQILELRIVNEGEVQCNVANRFLGSFFPILWGATYKTSRKISDPSLIDLMSLKVFTEYFYFPLPAKAIGRVATNFQAMLQANDSVFIQSFFGPVYLDDGIIKWNDFPGNYFSAFIKAIIEYGDQVSTHLQLIASQVEPVLTLSYIFNFQRTAEELHNMRISQPKNSVIFVKVLTHYFAPVLMAAMNTQNADEKEVSYKRIRRTADLVKLLPLNNQQALYQDDTYILFRLHNRSMKYAHQQAQILKKDSKKEAKMNLLNWLIHNFEFINRGVNHCPMQIVYNQCAAPQTPKQYVADVRCINNWLRNVILQNNAKAQGALGMFYGAHVESGRKGSKMAETLVLFSDVLLSKIFKGTDITLLEIWNAAFPARKCSSDLERIAARNAMILRDVADNEDPLPIEHAVVNPMSTNINNTAGNRDSVDVPGLRKSEIDNSSLLQTYTEERISSSDATVSNVLVTSHLIFPLTHDKENTGDAVHSNRSSPVFDN